MRHPLRILSIEDDPKDTKLIQDLLETEGVVCEVRRVDAHAALLASVEQGGIDLILADYSLPSFDGISALKFALKACPDVPFIFVSGTLGEEVAIEALKIGATDYVLKTRLSRLVPSVQRALREATERTERKRAEESLRQSETYLAEAQRLSHTGSFGWNVSGGEIYWSEETYKIFGYDRAARLTLELVLQRVHPDDRDPMQQTIDRATHERGNLDFEHRLLMPDGSVKHIHVLARAVEPSSGNLEYVGAVMDVTAARQAEETLRKSEAYLAEAQRLSHTGSWAWISATGDIRYWSEECYRVQGFDPNGGLPRFETLLQRLHPDDQAGTAEKFERAKREKAEFETDYRIVHPGGKIREIHVVGHPVLSPSGDLVEFVGTVIDVTERKRAEEERERLRRAEADLAHINRVTTMGELTASIAHEISQPVAAIVANAGVCLRLLAKGPPEVDQARECLEQTLKAGVRAGEIVNRIRALVKKSPLRKDWLDVNKTILEVSELTRGEVLRNHVSLKTRLSTDLPLIWGDRIQLQQVILNLIINAMEAMSGPVASDLVISSEKDGSDSVRVSVLDWGEGLMEGTLDRLFEAFYTTKSNGMGMGLAISRSIISDHGGRLWATPNVPRGAIFQFTLPTKAEAHE